MTDPSNTRKDRNNAAAGDSTDSPADSSRRNLIKSASLFGAAVAGAAPAALIAQESSSTSTEPAVREALEVLTSEEAETLEAICAAIIPSDENGPGANEARAAHYIDRSLGSHNIDHRGNYLVSLDAVNQHARSLHDTAFFQLSDAQQTAILLQLQNDEIAGCAPGSAEFFALVRSHTIDGTFCDPYYGGNRDFVGWDLLRYPGVRLSASPSDVEQGASLTPTHQSAYDSTAYTKRPGGSASGVGEDSSNG